MTETRERILHLTKKDFVFSYFRVSGSGGQHRDKTSSGCRVTHPPSGAVGEARQDRSQLRNKKTAFERMANSKEFMDWVKLEHSRAVFNIDSWVEEQLQPENLTVEYGPFDS